MDREGLDKPIREGLKGLSIIYITAFDAGRQIDKAICRQIDKPYMQICPYHQSNGLSNAQSKTVYKRYKHIPIGIQTISSGYKV